MKTPWPEDIGRVARQRRIDLNLSQDDLAERTSVTRQWLSRFETAKSDVSLSKVLAVLRELDLDLDVSAPSAVPEGTLQEAAMRSVAEINRDLLDDMSANIRRAMSRSGMSESSRSALDSLTSNTSYQEAMKRLAQPMIASMSEIAAKRAQRSIEERE
ncbi:transcriptional regulator with XRE-family HTH domain [Conyzicola lurida]|uniref:Transcriptional regulator with XRE-family HTH domain n=1 Tax=Conyzicola lurida TaxID=1172621 RepID=A0A841ANN5_9MICO|nr:helix-turn-helix transcriptional regulator [Conyzicola lurida]MBB5843316.1 transcriptional regulator with XRE-family HTH domain [Conyzicola lurida]